jgi:uncharacterized membrane protein
MAVSGYLLWVHWAGADALCSGLGGCEIVNTSPYAEVAGVPVALVGLVGYALLLALGLWAWLPVGRPAQADATGPSALWLIPLAIFGLSLVGLLYSAYLTYVEVFVLGALCPWCVLSALIISGIFIASWRGLQL